MANQDNIAPSVLNKNLEIVKVTDRSIAIQWEPAKDDKTPAKDIRYVVGLTEAENPDDPWHIVAEAKGICEFTFTHLKASTVYAFYVMAFDEAGNCTQYPLYNGSMTAKTLEAKPDICAPTVLNKNLNVVKVTENSISIQWGKATDDLTLAKEIRYVVGLTEAENPDDPWHIVAEAKDLCEFTFKNLKGDTLYAFYVMAFDEEGNMTQYPLYNGSMTAKTLAPDAVAPTALSKKIDVVEVTNKTISIKWQKATDDLSRQKEIRYVVGLTEAENPNDPWHIVREEKDICAHTFKGLKNDTNYAFYVMAYDEAGNMTQYPCLDGSMSAKTLEPDNKAPMAANKKLEITDVTEHTISIQWERAKDDNTKSKDVRYVIGLTETDNAQDPWHIVGEDTNICKFTFKWLKPGTNYSFYVMAYDEAGNMTQYPGLDKSETTMTLKEIPWWRKM